MSVNFNANSISNSWAGVDVQNISRVSEQIFQRAQQKTVDLTKVDLTKFNRQTQGIDLYSRNVSLETQRYIAMSNAGLFGAANDTIAKINAQAAANLYGTDISQKIQGKMNISVNETAVEKNVDVYPVFGSQDVISTSNISKDKRGASQFLFQRRSKVENEDNNESLDIQA